MRRMTNRGRYEGWLGQHEAGGLAVACVVPARFRELAEAGGRARPAKVVPTAPGTS